MGVPTETHGVEGSRFRIYGPEADGRIATLEAYGDERNVPIFRYEAIALLDALTEWLAVGDLAETVSYERPARPKITVTMHRCASLDAGACGHDPCVVPEDHTSNG